jgi:3-oxoacyl-[acyl-carrier-protein] synthase II
MSSTKSSIGHLLGAAGAVEAIFCIAGDPRPGGAADDQPRQSRRWRPARPLAPHAPASARSNVALSNSFGFGGTNASLIMGRVRD